MFLISVVTKARVGSGEIIPEVEGLEGVRGGRVLFSPFRHQQRAPSHLLGNGWGSTPAPLTIHIHEKHGLER